MAFTSKTITSKQIGIITDSTLLTWYNALTVKPSATLTTILNTLMAGLNTDGNLVEMDLFHVIGGMETSEQRLKPLKTTGTSPMTAVNTPLIGIEGITGNGSSSYLNLNWIPSTASNKHTLNNNSFGIYTRTDSSSNSFDIGVANGGSASIIESRFGGFIITKSYQVAENDDNVLTSSYGQSVIFSTGASATEVWKNGVQKATHNDASVSLQGISYFLCALNNGGAAATPSPKTQAMVFMGSSSVNQLTFYNRVQTAMGSLGLSV